MPKTADTDLPIDVPPALDVAVSPFSASEGAMPLIPCRVVYLGSNPHCMMPVRGRVREDTVGEGEDRVTTKQAGPSGFTNYDFTTKDAAGRAMSQNDPRRFMPAGHRDPEVRGKRVADVEHPRHLWALATMKDAEGRPMFKVFPKTAEASQMLQEFFGAQRRKERQVSRDYAEMTA